MEIVLIVCAALAAAQCEERSIPLDPEARIEPATCIMQSMPLVAQWAGEHPKLVVKRWSCREISKREVPA